MPHTWTITLIALGGTAFVMLIVMSIIAARRAGRRRREAMQAFAEEAGFSYTDKVSSHTDLGLPKIGLFGMGGGPRITQVMRGEIEDSSVIVFDYTYTISTGQSTAVISQTVVAISTGGAALPDFTLTVESFFHKIGQAFGYQDIDFDMSPEFSKKYLLRGKDEAAIRQVFNTRVVDTYMDRLGCGAEVRDGWLFVFKGGKPLKAEQIQPRIEATFAFLYELTGATRCAGLM